MSYVQLISHFAGNGILDQGRNNMRESNEWKTSRENEMRPIKTEPMTQSGPKPFSLMSSLLLQIPIFPFSCSVDSQRQKKKKAWQLSMVLLQKPLTSKTQEQRRATLTEYKSRIFNKKQSKEKLSPHRRKQTRETKNTLNERRSKQIDLVK